MSKQLPTDAITNELVGASAFFPKKQTQPPQPVDSGDPEKVAMQHKSIAMSERDAVQPTNEALTRSTQPTTMPAQPLATDIPSGHGIMPPRNHDTMPPDMMETIRKVVKQVGKEAATHRFTEKEKRKLADLVYTYERQGYRTSENEITRIAVNWLLWDYQEQGGDSVLARLLKTLHE